jgi:hypothetical protein
MLTSTGGRKLAKLGILVLAACLAAVVGRLPLGADLSSQALQPQVAAFVGVNVVPMDEMAASRKSAPRRVRRFPKGR